MKKVSWGSIAPIFADVVVSPWNLLVGGLLIRYLSTSNAFLSAIIGYFILGLIFYFYGGIGFAKKEQSAEIYARIFRSKITRYLIPSILAIGQIGWASINIELGGKSLAYVLSTSYVAGIALFTLALVIMGVLDLFKMGIVKLGITISAFGLLGYIFISKISQGIDIFSSFVMHQPTEKQSLLWGVSIVVASLISFSTVTPDFFQSVKSKKDVLLATLYGLCLPGVVIVLLGSFLFFDKGNFDLIALISALTFPVFPHIFNTITNTDGSIAIYTPGLKLQNMFGINLKVGIIIAGLVSFSLAMLQVAPHLETWLKILSFLFPTLIGLVIVDLMTPSGEKELLRKASIPVYIISTVISLGLSKFFPSVLISLLLPALLYKGFRALKAAA